MPVRLPRRHLADDLSLAAEPAGLGVYRRPVRSGSVWCRLRWLGWSVKAWNPASVPVVLVWAGLATAGRSGH